MIFFFFCMWFLGRELIIKYVWNSVVLGCSPLLGLCFHVNLESFIKYFIEKLLGFWLITLTLHTNLEEHSILYTSKSQTFESFISRIFFDAVENCVLCVFVFIAVCRNAVDFGAIDICHSLILCLLDLKIGGVLKSPAIIVGSSVSPCSSTSFASCIPRLFCEMHAH